MWNRMIIEGTASRSNSVSICLHLFKSVENHNMNIALSNQEEHIWTKENPFRKILACEVWASFWWEKLLGKLNRILGIDERKGRWVVVGLLDWIVLILVWFERSLPPAQVSWQSCPWPLKLMKSQAVGETWIPTQRTYRRFRGEWVKQYFTIW